MAEPEELRKHSEPDPSDEGQGDRISGTVGSNARMVAVGKNIKQVITVAVNAPVKVLIGGFAAVAFVLLGGGALLYRLTAPPPPTPATAQPMTGFFNVAIADFGQTRDENGPASQSKDGELLAEQLYENLDSRLKDIPELAGDVELQHQYINFVSGDAEARRRGAAELAGKVRADVVIYGNLNSHFQPARFVPELYISPRLTDAEETTGASVFGSTVDITLPLQNPDNRARLKKTLAPRFEALTEFMYALAFVKGDDPQSALEQLRLALRVPEWQEHEGKEIIYLWLGTALLDQALTDRGRAAQGESTTNNDINGCPLPGFDNADLWTCAREAYQKSIDLNSSFVRGHIGLGKWYADQAVQLRAGTEVIVCPAYERAIEEWQSALAGNQENVDAAHVALKTHFNLGLTYADALRSDCPGEQLYEQALANLTAASQDYEKDASLPLVRELGARTFFQLGRLRAEARDYVLADTAYRKAIEIAQPTDLYEDKWQEIRWVSYVQRGDLSIQVARSGDTAAWATALAAYTEVTKAYENNQHSHHLAAADAYYGMAQVQKVLGDAAKAQDNLGLARRAYEQGFKLLPKSDFATARLVQERLQVLGGSQ